MLSAPIRSRVRLPLRSLDILKDRIYIKGTTILHTGIQTRSSFEEDVMSKRARYSLITILVLLAVAFIGSYIDIIRNYVLLSCFTIIAMALILCLWPNTKRDEPWRYRTKEFTQISYICIMISIVLGCVFVFTAETLKDNETELYQFSRSAFIVLIPAILAAISVCLVVHTIRNRELPNTVKSIGFAVFALFFSFSGLMLSYVKPGDEVWVLGLFFTMSVLSVLMSITEATAVASLKPPQNE